MTNDNLSLSLRELSVYRELLSLPVTECALRLVRAAETHDREAGAEARAELFYLLRSCGHRSLGSWLAEALRRSESPYPLLAERGLRDEALEEAARRDIALLEQLALTDWAAALELPALPCLTAEAPFSFSSLTDSYLKEGASQVGLYRAFVWEDGALIPVEHPDAPSARELLGYDREREQVIANTRALLEGRGVNNVLLYGESGTGKSATVKHLLTLPGMEELRIIEADKENLAGLPALIRSLEGRRQKFIVFIDDLTFDRDDPTYAVLKTILEGGVERRPDNVAVYATSNRRHLVRQTISEREGDEMDRNETIREKTSLADRFGIRILFRGLRKEEYLAVVELLAHRRGIDLPREELHSRAIAWERLHGAQTPRTALQFVLTL